MSPCVGHLRRMIPQAGWQGKRGDFAFVAISFGVGLFCCFAAIWGRRCRFIAGGVRLAQYCARPPPALWRANDAQLLQLIHQTRCARVADAQVSLQERRRSLMMLAHQLSGLLDEAVVSLSLGCETLPRRGLGWPFDLHFAPPKGY